MKTICALTNWWPSKDNPLKGIFFKEQLNLLIDEYNFEVININYKTINLFSYIIKFVLNNCTRLFLIDTNSNLREYKFVCYRSKEYQLLLKIISVFVSKFKSNKRMGIGRYFSTLEKKLIYREMKKLSKHLNKFNLVYCLTSQNLIYQASILSSINGTKLIASEHGPFPAPGSSTSELDVIGLERADEFLAISFDKIRQILLQNIKLNKITYIGNLVDENVFTYSPIEHSCTTLIIVAAYSFYKNYELFLKTIEQLCKISKSEFKVIIAGYNGNKQYCINAQELETKIKFSTFSDKVELIPFVERNKMNLLYNRADAFVMTSIQEGQPVSALEAACCGLPIFSTKCGGVEDYVDDDIGRLVNINDYEQLAEYLKQFLEKEISFNPVDIRNKIISKFGTKAYKNKISQAFNSNIL